MPLECAWTDTRTHSLGRCPDRESNLQLSGYGTVLHLTEPHWPGPPSLEVIKIPGHNQGQVAVRSTIYKTSEMKLRQLDESRSLLGEGKFVSALTLGRDRTLTAR